MSYSSIYFHFASGQEEEVVDKGLENGNRRYRFTEHQLSPAISICLCQSTFLKQWIFQSEPLCKSTKVIIDTNCRQELLTSSTAPSCCVSSAPSSHSPDSLPLLSAVSPSVLLLDCLCNPSLSLMSGPSASTVPDPSRWVRITSYSCMERLPDLAP